MRPPGPGKSRDSQRDDSHFSPPSSGPGFGVGLRIGFTPAAIAAAATRAAALRKPDAIRAHLICGLRARCARSGNLREAVRASRNPDNRPYECRC